VKKQKLKKAADHPEVMEYVKAGWIPVLQTGKITDSGGTEHDFTIEKLNAIADAYDPEFRKAPLVIGHPKTDGPAYGWTAALKCVGEFLLALPEKVHEAFRTAVNEGRYNTRSVALKGNELRHIGFLGAALPACPGLGDVSLAEMEGDCVIEFGMPIDRNDPDWDLAWKIVDIGSALRSFREYLIEKDGIEQADKLLPNYLIDRLTQEPEAAPHNPEYTQGAPMDPKDKKIQELSAEVTELETQLTGRDNAAWEKTRDDFVSGLQKQGIILSAKVAEAKGMLDRARDAGKGEFSEEKNPALKQTMDFMRSQKPQLSPKEIATLNAAEHSGEGEDEAVSLARIAGEFINSEAAAGRTVTADFAVAHARKQLNTAR